MLGRSIAGNIKACQDDNLRQVLVLALSHDAAGGLFLVYSANYVTDVTCAAVIPRISWRHYHPGRVIRAPGLLRRASRPLMPYVDQSQY